MDNKIAVRNSFKEELYKSLLEKQDKEYGTFNSKLIPNIDGSTIIGVRVPELRKMAKSISGRDECKAFLDDLPHRYHEENVIHGVILSSMKDREACLQALEDFLPYVDNWAICDLMNPKVLSKDREGLLQEIKVWIGREETYTSRFAIKMLMTYFLDEYFESEHFDLVLSAKGEDYYLKMMAAWYFAEALAKQWDRAIKIFEEKRLEVWIHNKAIQKGIESLRISTDRKEYLRSLRVRKKSKPE